MSRFRWGSMLMSRLSSTLAKESPTLVSQESQAATRLPQSKVRRIPYAAARKGAASYIRILPSAKATRKVGTRGRLSSKVAAGRLTAPYFRILPIAKAARKVDTQGKSSSKVAAGKVAASYFPINLPVAKEAQKVDTEGSDFVVSKAEIVTPNPTSVSSPETSSLVQPTLPVSSDFARKRRDLIPSAICDQIVANLNLDITVPGEMYSDGPLNILYLAPSYESKLSRYLARAIHGANPGKGKPLTIALKDHTLTTPYVFGDPADNDFASFKSLGSAARRKAVTWAKNRRAKVTTHFPSPFSAFPCVQDLLKYNHGQYFFDVDIHTSFIKNLREHWKTQTAPLFDHAVHTMLWEPATTRNIILLAALVKPKGHIVYLLPSSKGLENVIRQILDHGLPLQLLSVKEVDIEPSLNAGRHQTVEIHSKLPLPSKQQLTNIYDPFWRERMMYSSATNAQITIARSRYMKDLGSHFIATFRRLPNAGPADSTVGLLNLYETLYGLSQKDSHERPVSDQDVDDAEDQDDDDDGALRTALERTESFTAASDPSSIDFDELKGEIARLETVISKMKTKMGKTPE